MYIYIFFFSCKNVKGCKNCKNTLYIVFWAIFKLKLLIVHKTNFITRNVKRYLKKIEKLSKIFSFKCNAPAQFRGLSLQLEQDKQSEIATTARHLKLRLI